MKSNRRSVFGMILFALIPSCLGADGLDDQDLLVGTWRWVETVTPVEVLRPLDGEDYQLTLTADGELHGTLETNQINSRYRISGSRFTVDSPMMVTMAAWREDSPAPGFIALMENATGYFFRDGELYIDTLADGGTLRFLREDS